MRVSSLEVDTLALRDGAATEGARVTYEAPRTRLTGADVVARTHEHHGGFGEADGALA